MIRNALLVDKENNIVNRIVHDDEQTYIAPEGCRIVFEDDAKKDYPKDVKGNVIIKDIGEKL